MPGRWRLLMVLGLTVIAMSPGKAVAQVTLQGSVNAPSTGNELTIEVSNVSAEAPVEGLRVALAAQPRHLTNVSILPERVPAVMPGQGVQFTIRFDVRPDAPAGQAETLALRVTAERGTTIDFPTPRLMVTFVKPAPPAAPTATTPSSPARLRLWRILPVRQPPAAGLAAATTHQGGDRDEASVRLDPLPLEIVPGQPFEIGIEMRQRRSYPDRWNCQLRERNRPDPPSMRLDIGSISALDFGGLFGGGNWAEFAAVGTGDFQLYCDEGSRDGRMVGSRDKDGALRFRLRFVPEPPPDGARPGGAYYSAQVSTDGTLTRATPQGQAKRLFSTLATSDPQGFVSAGVSVDAGLHAFGLRIRASGPLAISMAGIGLQYGPVRATDQFVASAAPHSHPVALGQPPRGATGIAGATAPGGQGGGAAAGEPGSQGPATGSGPVPRPGDPATPGATGADSGRATASLGPGSSGTQGGPGAAGATGPSPGRSPATTDPARLDPRSPEVAPLIRQWIGVAEPPDNARGARLRYDEWGRMVGAGINREQITAGARPDAAGGMGSTEYVWTLRDRLDSVNHCRLGEYVGAMLRGDSIAGCQNRYKAPPLRRLLNLAGLPAQEAEARVRALGLVPDLIGGDPAPSREREYTVQSQEPQGGSQVREGDRVALRIHSGYVDPRRPVPAVLGLPRGEAEARVRAAGFRPLASEGREPSSSGQQGVVEEQFPTEGTRLFPGSQVTLKVAARPVPTQPPAGSGEATPQVGARPGEGPRSGEPEVCATYYSNLPDLGRGANTRMAQLAAQSAVAAGCDPGRVQQAVTGTLSPGQPGFGPSPALAPSPPPPPAVASPPPAPPAWPAARPWPGQPQGTPPQPGVGAEPAACAKYYETLTELARADEGPNGAVAQMTARSALAGGCSPQRVQQALAAGAASPYSRRAAPPVSPPPSSATPQRVTPPPAEPAVCNTHYSNLYQWSRAYPGGSTHQAVQNEARRALAAGCNRQRVELILAQGRPQTPQRPSGGVNTGPPASQGLPPPGECPGGRIAILGQC